jgi:hypothetical protein
MLPTVAVSVLQLILNRLNGLKQHLEVNGFRKGLLIRTES